MARARRLIDWAPVLLPGALTVYFAFNAGGYFVGSTGVVAAALLVLLVLRITLVGRPFAGFAPLPAVIASLLALFAVWTLLSNSWSDAPARALLEFDRALLYLAAFVLLASIPRTPQRLGWLIRFLALGILVVCVCGLITRVAPDVWSVESAVGRDRLSYPVTYWNALGFLGAAGLVLCLHMACSLREPRVVQVLASMAVPLLATTILFTFSRGAIAAGAIGVLAYLVIGRPHGMLGGLLATVPASILAVVVAYQADELASNNPTSAQAVDQGHDVAAVLGVCLLAVAGIRLVLAPADERVSRVRLPGPAWAPLAALAAVVLVALLAVDAPDRLERQYDRFVNGPAIIEGSDLRERLSNPGNNGRLEHWEVSYDSFKADRLKGSGAGTYQVVWARERDISLQVVDAHSLYIEVLGELGFVGIVLLAGAILTILVGLLLKARGGNRSLYAAAFAAVFAWAIHAGVDWDWEMASVTTWVFALSGAALARPAPADRLPPSPGRVPRILLALGCLLLAVTPAVAALSQHRLNESVAAFKRGDCRTASDAALGSLSALSIRPEPWEILSYCDTRAGLSDLAVRAVDNAVERDPDNWEFHYARALVLGAAGKDPRPAARRALRLNPREPLTQRAAKLFRGESPRRWRRDALASPLFLP